MELEYFIKNIFINDQQQSEYDSIENELIKIISKIIYDNDDKSFYTLLEGYKLYTLNYDTDKYDTYLELLEPLFILFKPKLSFLFENISHVFCDCCDIYIPCDITSWKINNEELFNSEIPFFFDLINRYEKYITIDCECYNIDDILNLSSITSSNNRLSGLTSDEKLKQLYSIVKYYNEIIDD